MNTEMEIWKDVVGYEGLYQISSIGNVKSMSRIKMNRGIYPVIYKENILKFIFCGGLYHTVRLYKDGKWKAIKVHRLVATHFIDNPLNLPYVNHIDNIGSNNYYKNLEWADNRSNQTHRRILENSSSSKYTGVSWNKKAKKWEAYYTENTIKHRIGSFTNEDDAYKAYLKALSDNGLKNHYEISIPEANEQVEINYN